MWYEVVKIITFNDKKFSRLIYFNVLFMDVQCLKYKVILKSDYLE